MDSTYGEVQFFQFLKSMFLFFRNASFSAWDESMKNLSMD